MTATEVALSAEAKARAEIARLVAEQGMPDCSFGVLASPSALWPEITLVWVYLRTEAEVDRWAALLGLTVEVKTTYRDDKRDGLRHYLRTYRATADRWVRGVHVIFEGSRSHTPPAWTAEAVKS